MMTLIYECFHVAITFLVAIALARYVFLIPALRQRMYDYLYITASVTAAVGICVGLGQIPAIIAAGMLIGIYIFISVEHGKGRYAKAMLVLPIMGFSFGILLPPIDVPCLLWMPRIDEREGFALVLYLTLMISQIVIRSMCDEWCKSFRQQLRMRKLGQWERFLLCIIGVLMLVVTPVMSIYDNTPIRGPENHVIFTHLRCIISVICFVVTLTVCILVMRSSQNVYLREQILQMQNSLIITMADIVENRDENTGGHIRRTAKYVEILGLALKANHIYSNILTDQYISDMVVAAPLHDIGKSTFRIPSSKKKDASRRRNFRS